MATMEGRPMTPGQIDHSECVPAGTGNARSHTHEGATGAWLFPGDLRPDGTPRGLYDESPAGAGF